MKPSTNKIVRVRDANGVKPINPSEQLSIDLVSPLIVYILAPMRRVRISQLEKLANDLLAIAQYLTEWRNTLAFYRDNKGSVRAMREKIGRAQSHVRNSIKALERAEKAIGPVSGDLKQGTVDFPDARKDLELLNTILNKLESTTAAVIHPGLRTRMEKELAIKSPYKLHESTLPITGGSAALQYHAVELIDDHLQNFTHGKVSPKNINTFISEFLKISMGWHLAESNVKTMRHRIKIRRSMEATVTASNPSILIR